MPSVYARCWLPAVLALACDSNPAPKPSTPSATVATSTPSSAPSLAPSSAPLGSAPGSAAPLGSAEREAQHRRLRELVPASMPAACKLKPLRNDAPPWLKHNPEVSSERSFIDEFAPVALPGGNASHIESALYLVYEEAAVQSGLFGFGFAHRDMASFARELFDRSRPKHADRFALEQRGDLLIVQWTDGAKGACWEALTAHRTKSKTP